jgi:uncharacterized protein (DUF427 family)
MLPASPDPVAPGQESVWDYPRPPRAEPTSRHIQIAHGGTNLAETSSSIRTLETSHPPTYYIPQSDIAMSLLTATDRTSFCEWKGHAVYWTVAIAGSVFRDVGWSYPDPTRGFAMLRDHIAFYAAPFDQCLVDDVRVVPQPGGFYGGWITPDVAGPFKGIPGSNFW